MQISLFLLPFYLFLLIFAGFAISAIFHIVRFELLNVLTILITVIFSIGTIFILSVSFSYISNIDWDERITLESFGTYTTSKQDNQEEDAILTF